MLQKIIQTRRIFKSMRIIAWAKKKLIHFISKPLLFCFRAWALSKTEIYQINLSRDD